MSWLLDTLAATAALIALVLVLRRPAARLFGPGLAYALWILPLLRLVLPPLVLPAQPAASAAAPALAGTVISVTAAAPSAPAWGIVAPLLQAVWLAGALTFLLWRAWSYAAMRRRMLAGARSVGEAGNIRLVESAAALSPVAFGILDKVVALPPGFINRADTAGRDLAIAHELQHHAGRDLVANLAMQPLLALHWFNPLAWAGWRAMRRDQEAACDARVLAGRDPETRFVYAHLIAAFAAAPRQILAAPLACPVVGEKNIVYRLRSLTMTQPTPQNRLFGRLLLASAVIALPLTATISYAAQDAPPAPPAAPQVPAAPAAPAVPNKVTRIVIVESDNPDDDTLHSRTVTRGERTFEFRTKQKLSDADLERRMAEIESSEHMTGGAVFVGMPEGADGKHVVRHVVMVPAGGGHAEHHAPI
ncbi:MAG: M56 family metallopeptidase, partial [Novosphingobium sp.]|uniref:M56 family metallopeptidase n=1 Tax=Novosphingobium sp. TaxID=1874826 RepID=UPI0032BD3282